MTTAVGTKIPSQDRRATRILPAVKWMFASIVAVVIGSAGISAHATGRPVPARRVPVRAVATVAPTFTVKAFSYGADPMQHLTATYAPARHAAPWLLTVHGGSWIHGSELNMTRSVALFSRHGWQAFNLTYRMGPDVTYAEQLADLRAARDWIKAHAAQFGINPARGTVYGFSAGGELAAAVGGFPAVVSVSGVLQPQRIAQDAMGMRAEAEPATEGITNLYWRETQMMGCPFQGADAAAAAADPCVAAWRAFCPEYNLGRAGAFYIVQGADDPVVPPPTASAFAYHVRAAGGSAVVTIVPGYGHSEYELTDSPSRMEAMLQWDVAHDG